MKLSMIHRALQRFLDRRYHDRKHFQPRLEELEARINPSTLAMIADLGTTNASGVNGGLIRDSAGNFYGTTSGGGGTPFDRGAVFELTGGQLQILASFTGANGGGEAPEAGLIMDASGNLYGTTSKGGAIGDGTVFEVVKGSGQATTLASFSSTTGQTPLGSLVMDASGNLYGTTSVGGTDNDGTIFEVAAGTNQLTTIATFNGANNGSDPNFGLVMDGSGNLYGTTNTGGVDNDGTIFELAKGSHTATTLATFNNTNGRNPDANMIMDAAGDLFGTAGAGSIGPCLYGAVFELPKGSHTIKDVAVDFNASTTGGSPRGVVMDGSGDLFGSAFYGQHGQGTVFEVAKGSSTPTLLAPFGGGGAPGYPYPNLEIDSSGNVFGTA